MKRSEHLFQFSAATIAKAARKEAEFHEQRESWWRSEQEDAAERAIAGAKIELVRAAVTGGERLDISVHHDDPTAVSRMQEAFRKAEKHRLAADEYRTHAAIYESQHTRTYELDPDDVHHFRLGQATRDEVSA